MSARRTLSAASFVVVAAAFLAPVSAAQASWFTGSWAGLFAFWTHPTPAEGCIPSEVDAAGGSYSVDDCGVQEPQ